MSYKPTTGVNINDNDFKLVTSEAVYEALQLKQDVITPGDVDKVLASDGSSLTWQYAGLGAGSLGTGNVILGRAKPASLTGTYNFLVGPTAGSGITTGLGNIAIGNSALLTSQVNSSAIAIGNTALQNFRDDANTWKVNLAIGGNALKALTTGFANVAIGYDSLVAGTTQQQSVAIGQNAGRNSTGNNQVFVGLNAGHGASTGCTGGSNTVVGWLSLFDFTSGSSNTTLGSGTGRYLTSASSNTFVGYLSGQGNTTDKVTGSSNTALGNSSLTAITSGAANIAIGNTAGDALTTGSNNVIIGDIAGSAALADTMIFAAGAAERFRVDSSGNMGIGTSTPSEKLHVSGNAKFVSALFDGSVSGTLTQSAADTTTSYSIKWPSAQGVTDTVLANDGSGNLTWQYAGLGAGSLGTSNVILGRSKPASLAGNNIVVVGDGAGNSLTSAVSSNFIGALSGATITTQSYNNFFGQQAGRYATVTNSIFIGHAAGRGAPAGFSGNTNVGIGHQVLLNATNVFNATLVGAFAGTALTTGSGNTVIGASAGTKITTHSNQVLIGVSAAQFLTANNTTAIGYEAGKGVDGSSTGTDNTFVGIQAGKAITTGARNLAVGGLALTAVTEGSQNVALGQNASSSLTTAVNTCTIGLNAGRRQNSSSFFAFGVAAAEFQTGSGTMAIGTLALQGVDGSSTGVHNVAIGLQAARAVTSANNTTAIGNFSGNALTTGSSNILIGYNSGRQITTGSNNVIIGQDQGSTTLANTIIVQAGTAERFRVDSSGNMGIGTSTPSEKLEVVGAVKADEFTVTRGGGEVYRLDPHTHDEGTETGNFTINWSNGSVHTVTLNAAGPLVITMSNPVDGGAYALRIIQGATPGTVTWPASVKWPGGTPPTLSTGTGDVDVVNLLYYADTGFYYATFALDFA